VLTSAWEEISEEVFGDGWNVIDLKSKLEFGK